MPQDTRHHSTMWKALDKRGIEAMPFLGETAMRCRLLIAALMLAALASSARAQNAVPSFNPAQCNIPAACVDMINNLLTPLNKVLNPLFPNTSTTGVINQIAFTGGTTGNPVVIGVAPGSDANASIAIRPAGNGAITLFSQFQQGLLGFGNQFSWVATNGLSVCPGVNPSLPPNTVPGLQVGSLVSGYFYVKDWLGRSHAMVACG